MNLLKKKKARLSDHNPNVSFVFFEKRNETIQCGAVQVEKNTGTARTFG